MSITLSMSTTHLESVIFHTKLPADSAVIWLHGLGADGHDFVNIVPQLNLPDDLAIRFIFPHAPVRPVTLNGGMAMRAWFDIYGLSRLSKIDDKGIKTADASIGELIIEAHESGIAFENIVLAGFSQGGALALYTGLHFPQRLGGILALSTYLPVSESVTLPQPFPNQKTPIFMAHGEYDPIVALDLGVASKGIIQRLGCTVDWRTYPMEHSVCMEEIQDIGLWFQKVLGTVVR